MAIVEGYDVEVIQEISSDLYCVICLKLMRNPVQFKCGHGMCYVCFKSLLHRSSQRSSTQCPQCREVVKEGQIISNVMLHRLILSLDVRCPNNERGCKWTGELDRFESHLEQCSKNADQPTSHKKSKKKKVKKESPSDHQPNTQSLQNELLLQITEQLSKLNDRLHRVAIDRGGEGSVATTKVDKDNVLDETWFNYFLNKSVTASCKTKFLALLLFTISLFSGMFLLGNPALGMTSSWKGESPELQKGLHQLYSELAKINSLIYAQQNNFFQLHLGSKELQTELETQKTMFLKLLGLYMRNTLQDAHFKKRTLLDQVNQQWANEMGRVKELGRSLLHQFDKIKQHCEMQLRLAEKQPLDLWLFKKAKREEVLFNLVKMLDSSSRDINQSLQLANTTSGHRIINAFQEARRKLQQLQNELTDFNDFSYTDIKQHLIKEFEKSDVGIMEKINETSERYHLTVLSQELIKMHSNMSQLANQTLQNYQQQVSYRYQFHAIMKTIENIDTKNGQFVWQMNSSMLATLPDGHGFYSKIFTAFAPQTLLEQPKYAKLWLLRSEKTTDVGTWKITYEQDPDARPINIKIAILNQLNEEFLPCEEIEGESSDLKKVIVDFQIPMTIDSLINHGYMMNEKLYIRCNVVPK